MKRTLILVCLLLVSQVLVGGQLNKNLILEMNLDNFFYYKNDSDFDNSKRLYQPEGDSEGILATYLNSQITFNITDEVYIFYELELGSNIWSKNNPDITDPISNDIFVLKHRQIFGSAELLENSIRVRSGYMRLMDPSGLFINHWIGALQLGLDIANTKNSLTVSQIPDSNYEGLTASTNNFANDRWLFAASSSFNILRDDVLTLGWFTLYDDTVIRHSNLIHSPLFSYMIYKDSLKAIFDAVLQFGVEQNASLYNEDIRELSYGLNLNLTYKFTDFILIFNGLFMSPDDKYNNNRYNGGFYYSGKNRSSTLILSEDELRDQYNNIDERLSVSRGPFFVMRAGLLLFDIKVDYTGLNILQPSIVAGGAFVANRENANDSSFVGFESDLLLKIDIERGWDITGAIGILIPGGAASAFVNMYDLRMREPQYLGEVHINYRY